MRCGSAGLADASDVIGQQLAIDGGMYNVIGVLPADFRWAGEPVAGTATEIQAWFPLAANQLAGARAQRAIPESDRDA